MSPNLPHPAQLPEDRLLLDCQIRTGRRRGPGGQHRNKVETAVVIQHRMTGIRGEASERRSQAQNRAVAIRRLRINLALEVRSRDPGSSPSPLWKSRCQSGRIAVSRGHEDFPSLLAEALDWLDQYDYDLSRTAQTLQVSSSQLIKLLKLEPRALEQLNQHRREAGLRPLQ